MQKNVSGQYWVVYAFDVTTNLGVPSDASNITAKISKDGAAGSATNDVNPTELEDGYYVFDLTQAESNADLCLIMPESSTEDVQVIGCPAAVYPRVDEAIKAKTDEMTFTKANELDVNELSKNGVSWVGDGSTTPFTV